MAFYYNTPLDDIAATVTPTVVEGTADANYPALNVGDDNLAHVAKFTALGGGVELALRYDFTSTVGLRFFSLHNFNLDDSALSFIHLVSDSSSDVFTPVARTTFTATYSGLADDGFSMDPYLASALAGATARRYWYVIININSGLPQIGRIWMGTTLRSFARGFRYDDFGPSRVHPTVVHRTMGSRLSYPFGTREEVISGTIRCDSSDYAALKTLSDIACRGSVRSCFPIVLDSTGSTLFIGANESMFVRFAEGWTFAPRFTPNAGPGLMDVPVSFECVSRGLVLS